MGDTGSLALGGIMAAMAMTMKIEVAFIVIAGIFVMDTLSVIIQITSVKTRHKKVFVYTPIHFAFRIKGMPENSVVHMFWLIEACFAALGLFIALHCYNRIHGMVLLEIGLGAGASLQAMMKEWPASHAIAIDHTSQTVTMAARSNADAIKQGRCIVMEGEACHLPFPDDTFDLIVAFDSISSWKNLNDSVLDIYAELVAGGCFAIINADAKGPGLEERRRRPL